MLNPWRPFRVTFGMNLTHLTRGSIRSIPVACSHAEDSDDETNSEQHVPI